jgi:hypothetical protein
MVRVDGAAVIVDFKIPMMSRLPEILLTAVILN